MGKIKGSRNAPVQGTVSGFIEDGISVIKELAEEMSSWRDSLEESFSHTEKYEAVSTAADELENVEEIEVDNETLAELSCSTTQDTRKSAGSRAKRLENALNLLSAAMSTLEEYAETLEDEDDGTDDLRDEANDLVEQIGTAIGYAESVEFPGMYG